MTSVNKEKIKEHQAAARQARLEGNAGTLRQQLTSRLLAAQEARGREDLRYVKYTRGGAPAEVKCKWTGEWVHGLIEQEGVERKETDGRGRTTVYKRLVQAYSADAMHLRIYFDDQSDHVTIISRQCFQALENADEETKLAILETLYMGDVAQWLDEESRGLGRVRDEWVGQRIPVSYQEEPL